MPRSIKNASEDSDYTAVVPIGQGGTGKANAVDALEALGGIKPSVVGLPLGPLPLKADGTIDPAFLAGLSFTDAAIDGDATIALGETKDYFLTTHDSYIGYIVEGVIGTATINRNVITYKPTGVGTGGFTVNGRRIYVEVSGAIVLKPAIESPVDGSTNIPASIVISGSAFEITSGTDTHVSSDWELATDAEFTQLVASSYGDTTNKTSWPVSVVQEYTKYYARVRYTGALCGLSQWSTAISFTGKESMGLLYQTKFYANDIAAGDVFGHSIGITPDGMYAVVSSYADDDKGNNSGSVYIFTRTGNIWTQQQKIVPADGEADDYFGIHVAINADATYLAVGAHCDNDRNTDAGSVYIYTRSGSVWTLQTKLYANDPAVIDYFGKSVALNADATYLLVGAYGKSDKVTCGGAIYVFTRSGTTWTQQSKFYPTDFYDHDYFGMSLAMDASGKYAIVGTDSTSRLSSAYIFYRASTTFEQVQKLTAIDAVVGDRFGFSVSMTPDASTVVIGAIANDNKATDAGAFYVFTKTASLWVQKQKLYAPDAAEGDGFGAGIAVNADGSYVLVGAYCDDDKGSNAGSVYVFSKNNAMNYIEGDKLYASDAAASRNFGAGCALSLDGQYAIVGDNSDSTKASSAGTAYVFKKVSGVWVQQTKLYATDAQANDGFGTSCALNSDGTYAIVGARGDDDRGTDAGSVYAFTRVGDVWTQESKFCGTDTTADDLFGTSCGLSSDASYAVVGAQYRDDKGTNSGSAYVFTRSGAVWTQQAKLLASDGAESDYFATGCGINGDGSYIIVGCQGDDDKTTDAGSVYVFTRSGTVWTQQGKFYASDASASDYFGCSCAINADATYAVVGAYNDADKGTTSGSLYLFVREGTTWFQVSKIYGSDETTSDAFGRSCALSGDAKTLLVGCVGDDDKGTNAGATYTYSIKNILNFEEYAKIYPADSKLDGGFGRSVCFNSDATYAIVGACNDDDKATNAGAAYIFTRTGTTWTQQAKIYPNDPSADDYFAMGVSINADATFAAVANVYDDDKGTNAGAAYIFTRTGTVWTQQAKVFAADFSADMRLGSSVSLNADATFLAVGAYNESTRAARAGCVYIFTRTGNVWSQHSKVFASDAQADDYFGISCCLNADATYLIVGAWAEDDKGSVAGAAYVFTRSGSSWTQQQKIYAPDAKASQDFGYSVAINADATYAVIGAYNDSDSISGRGAAYTFYRNGTTWVVSQKLYASDATFQSSFGCGCSISADAGYVAVGAMNTANAVAGSSGGAVYIFR